jgi:serine/threonine protein phosphatase 1
MTHLEDNYKKLDLDTTQRHFVFGDIHGHFGTFLDLLNLINYDEERDVIYSVGDLIDRGPQSTEVVEFWENHPKRHVTRGNHEQMLVAFGKWESCWMYAPNGGPATLASLADRDRSIEWLKDFCRSLPIVIDVGDNDDPNAFRIVHAEHPAIMSNEDIMRILEHTSTEDLGESDLLWSRNDITTALQNVSRMLPTTHNVQINPNWGSRKTYSGHTPVKNSVVKMGHQHWIDTSWGDTMTCVEVLTDKAYSTKLLRQ